MNTLGKDPTGILVKITEFVAASERHPKVARFCLQAVAISLLPEERIRVCQHVALPNRAEIDVWHSEKRSSARYGGLMRCALAWVCPLCAMRIAEKRRTMLNQAFSHARGELEPFLVTYTVRHKKSDHLLPLIERLNAAYRHMRQQRSWRNFKAEHAVNGEVRALEITYGDNGWHPHFHVVTMVKSSAIGERELDPCGVPIVPARYVITQPDREYWSDTLQARLSEHWKAALNWVGRTVEDGIGVKVQPGQFASAYVAKLAHWSLAHELTGQARKGSKVEGGRTVWDLLLWHWAGDPLAGSLFREYHAATKGRSSLQWSPGLREELRVNAIDHDDQLDDPDLDEILLSQLSLSDWKIIVRHGAQGKVLEIASLGDPVPLARFIERLRDVEYGSVE